MGKHKVRGTPLAQPIFIPNWGPYDYLDIFKPWLEDENALKVGHNIFTYDKHIFENHDIYLKGILADTMRLAKLVFNNKAIKNDLKALLKRNFNYQYGSFKELFSAPGILKEEVKTKDRQTWRKVEGRRVPTFIASGVHSRFSYSEKSRRLLKLSEIHDKYPSRLQTLIEYASLDAKGCLELFPVLKKKAEAMK